MRESIAWLITNDTDFTGLTVYDEKKLKVASGNYPCVIIYHDSGVWTPFALKKRNMTMFVNVEFYTIAFTDATTDTLEGYFKDFEDLMGAHPRLSGTDTGSRLTDCKMAAIESYDWGLATVDEQSILDTLSIVLKVEMLETV